MNKTTIPIKGMHCRSCELLIEGELCELKGVKKVEVSQKKGTAEISFEGNISSEKIKEAVENAGYQIGFDDKKPLFARNFDIYRDLLIFLLTLFFGFMFLDLFGIKISAPAVSSNPSSLFVVLLVGITAGFSTCMALIGGLILGVSARFAEKHPRATPSEKFKPHLFFNIGRITSYLIFGGVIGFVGSFFQLSGMGLGLLIIAVSLVMLLMGIQLTGISPKLENFKLTIPPAVAKSMGIHKKNEEEYSNKNAALMGALTFFLPCGFTQAMQLFAMTTGSPVRGALIMGTFAIGTAPGLLGIGGVTSVVKGAFAETFFRIAGVVVIILSLFNLSNGLNLTGLNPLYVLGTGQVLGAPGNIPLVDGKQIIRMTQDSSGYTPNSFVVKKGISVRWIIDSKDPNTCAASLVSDSLGVRKQLQAGENIIEFTPENEGNIRFTCSMGMFTGNISVVSNSGGQIAQAAGENPPAVPTSVSVNNNGEGVQGASCGSKGCGCGGGARQAAKPAVAGAADDQGEVQVIKTTYTSGSDISPNEFTVKSGKKVRMEIDVKDNGSGCMSTIMVPRLTDGPQFLAKGKTITFEFTPTNTGNYPITCAMGVPRGVIKVI